MAGAKWKLDDGRMVLVRAGTPKFVDKVDEVKKIFARFEELLGQVQLLQKKVDQQDRRLKRLATAGA